MKNLETPFITLDYSILKKNIKDMQATANKAGVTLRPHAKTHKSHKVAELQIEAGAVGLTVAKPEEALTFIKNGVKSVKICYPIISRDKIKSLLIEAKKHNAEIIFALDSLDGFEILKDASENYDVQTYIEIDVGLNRCGLKLKDTAILEVAQKIQNSTNIKLKGITSHAGQSYGAKTKEAAKQIAEQEREIMLSVKQSLETNDITVQEICVGATPTLWAQENFEGISEIKPGNYVYNDLTQKNIGVVGWERLAISVVASIVSINDTYLIVDAGSKTMTSDAGAHGTTGVSGYGLAFPEANEPNDTSGLSVEKLSEEHGWIKHNGTHNFVIGDRLRIFPNHSCPVINLFDKVQVFEDGKHFETWKVDARGCVN